MIDDDCGRIRVVRLVMLMISLCANVGKAPPNTPQSDLFRGYGPKRRHMICYVSGSSCMENEWRARIQVL